MSISYRTAPATSQSSGGVTTFDVTKQTGTQPNDLIFLYLWGGDNFPFACTGFTAYFDDNDIGGVLVRVADGTEGTTFTITGLQGEAVSVIIATVAGASATVTVGTDTFASGVTSYDVASIDMPTSGWVLWFVANESYYNSPGYAITPPAGYSAQSTNGDQAGNPTVMLADNESAAAGATGIQTGTCSTAAYWSGVMVGLTPGVTVTAAQTGSTYQGILLTVKVVTGAAAVQNGATTANDSTITTCELPITPTANGSWVYGAASYGDGATAFTAAGGTTFSANVPDATNSATYGTFRTTGTTTAGTPVTVGASAPSGSAGDMGVALTEILAAGTLAEDVSSPASVSTFTATSISTAAFTPPAGSLLVATVASDTGGSFVDLAISDSSGLTWTLAATDTTLGVAAVFTAQFPLPPVAVLNFCAVPGAMRPGSATPGVPNVTGGSANTAFTYIGYATLDCFNYTAVNGGCLVLIPGDSYQLTAPALFQLRGHPYFGKTDFEPTPLW